MATLIYTNGVRESVCAEDVALIVKYSPVTNREVQVGHEYWIDRDDHITIVAEAGTEEHTILDAAYHNNTSD